MKVRNIDKYAVAAVRDAGGSVQEVDSNIEVMPGRFLKEYAIEMPEGTLSLAHKNNMSNLDETYFLLPTDELVKVYMNKLTQEHPMIEDAWKAEVRKANA